jgi:hypothetical protein
VGLFNDIVILQAINFPQVEALDHEVVVLALPALPPADPFLEGNNDQNEQGAQNLNPNADDNLIVGSMTHLSQPSEDPAYDDFLARKRFSSWAELVGLRGGYASAKQNFQPHKTKNYCGYRSWNYH